MEDVVSYSDLDFDDFEDEELEVSNFFTYFLNSNLAEFEYTPIDMDEL